MFSVGDVFQNEASDVLLGSCILPGIWEYHVAVTLGYALVDTGYVKVLVGNAFSNETCVCIAIDCLIITIGLELPALGC